MTTGPANPPKTTHRLAELLSALSFASDMGIGLPLEYGARCCYISMRVGQELGLSTGQLSDLYYAELVKMAGCTCGMHEFAGFIGGNEIAAFRDTFAVDPSSPWQFFSWMLNHVAVGMPATARVARIFDFFLHGREIFREGTRGQCEVGRRIAQRLGLSEGVQEAVLHFCEQWDGKGLPDGLKGNDIPHPARMLHMSATISFFYWFGGRSAAQDVANRQHGKVFDPEMANAFLSVSAKEDFWRDLEQKSLWETVLNMEPESPKYIGDAGLHDLAHVLGDFVDMKTPHSVGHSRSVARVAERIARRMNLAEQEIVSVYRAGLIHDLGLAGVPAFTLARPHESLSDSEKEQVRLHPYHGERILSRLPGLEPIAGLVGLHHERLDGQGFYRGLSGAQIPVGARALALADAFHELSEDRPDRQRFDPEEALAALKPSVGSQLDPDCFRALADELGVSVPTPVRQQWPAGLTDREVEVLQVTVKGLTRRQMAERLFVSESTVRHHLESIYSKIGVSSRAAAVLFAVENDLLR